MKTTPFVYEQRYPGNHEIIEREDSFNGNIDFNFDLSLEISTEKDSPLEF